MHIPDGYLAPSTCGVMYAIMLPLWISASNTVKKTLNAKQVPLLSIGAAFSFVIMMFNIPIPGGSTGHAVGSVLVAILLGPWAAMIAITVALTIQALIFGDGGILALGANCFNMAAVMPLAGYWTYRAISGSSSASSTRKFWAACIAGYVGINAAAFFTGFEFGIQPLLYHDETGRALYCPYNLPVALGAMMGEHLLLFGWIEGLVTGIAIKFIEKETPELIRASANV